MNFSNREKNIVAAIALNIVVSGFYFINVLAMPAETKLLSMSMFTLVVSTSVLTAIAGLIMWFLANGLKDREPEDERDRVIAAKANSIAYSTLFFLVIIFGVLIAQPTGPGVSYRALPTTLTPFVLIHYLVGILTIAELVQNSTKITLYRRGS